MRFNHDTIVITDPCYLMKTRSDWAECDYGQCMERLGITLDNHYVNFTNVGDGEWKIRDKATKKLIGSFGADSGQIGVFLLSEVLRYNPDFLTKYPYMDRIATVIEDFAGDIDFYYSEKPHHAMQIEGRGTTKGKEISFKCDLNRCEY